MFTKFLNSKSNNAPAANRLVLFLKRFATKQTEKMAQSLSNSSGKFTQTQIRSFLYLFIGAGLLINSYIIVSTIKDRKAATPLSIAGIKNIKVNGQRNRLFKRPKYNQSYLQLIQLEIYLDSLKGTIEGKREYDSFLQVHPHFPDSLQALKQLYRDH